MLEVNFNGESNSCQVISGSVGNESNGNNITGSSHYPNMGSNSIGSNNLSNHTTSGVWGPSSESNMVTTDRSSPCINVGLNPNTLNPNNNHGAWPQNPTPSPVCQGQRPPQAQVVSSKLGMMPKQVPPLGSGGMAALDNSSLMEDTAVNNGSSNGKVLDINSGSGGLQSTNLSTEPNGPNNTIMTITTTNTTMTSTPPNSTASPQLDGDCSWGSFGGGNRGLLACGSPSIAPHPPQGELGGTGAIGTPWGTSTYPFEKGPPNADTVNSQISSAAAFKSNNNHHNTGASHYNQAPTNNPPQSNLSWVVGPTQVPGSAGQTPVNGNQTAMTPQAGMPHPWGSSASSTSSSSSSTSNNKMSNGEWGLTISGNNHSDTGSHKGVSTNNGWKSLEDDAMGIGGAGVSGSHGLGSVTGGWGRSGESEGSGEGSGSRSTSDRECNQSKGGNRRKGIHSTPVVPALAHTDVDPRVLSNTGWGQTPIRQNTAWDVNSPNNQHQSLRGDERKLYSGGSGWGTGPQMIPSRTSGGRSYNMLDCFLV